MAAKRSGFPLGLSPARLAGMAAVVALIVGCAPLPPKETAPSVPVVAAPTLPSNFTLSAGELETWNAVGQLLVRQPGVTYQGRSQKLGLYSVDYKGESFFVLTRAVLASAEVRTLTTEVRVALQNGSVDQSVAATELLAILQARLPDELIRIAALPKPVSVKAKPAKKKSVGRKRGGKEGTRR